MMKKNKSSNSFLQKMKKYTKGKLNEFQKVEIAKNKYLLENKSEIIKAKALGYTYPQITEVATQNFLQSGVSKSFTVVNQEGKEMKYETKIRVKDIQNICESSA